MKISAKNILTALIVLGFVFSFSSYTLAWENVRGSITVCKVAIDSQGNIINGSALPGSQFSISITGPSGPLDTTFTTPLSLNKNFVGSSANDARCITYNDLNLGEYEYGEETVPAGWGTPKYNDQFNTPVNDLNDFFSYVADGPNDDADGSIILASDRPNRELVILNTLTQQPFCGDGIKQSNEECDDGNTQNGDGCSTVCQQEFARLKVTKIVINNNGGAKNVSDFPLFVNSTPVTSGVQNVFSPGTYTVSETAQLGYASSISGDCSSSGLVTLAFGQNKSCTITNDDIPARLNVTKIVINDNGGNKTVSQFQLFIDNTSVTSGASNIVLPGAHVVSEISQPGYVSSISGNCTANGQVNISLGQNKSCTITNNDLPGKLIVIKHVINNDGRNKTAADFNITVSGNSPSPSSFSGLEAGTNVTINSGSYSVNETLNTGYAAAFSANCTGTIANNQTKICVITNDDVAACGDSVVQQNEQCDDGNNNNGDGCSAECEFEVQFPRGREECYLVNEIMSIRSFVPEINNQTVNSTGLMKINRSNPVVNNESQTIPIEILQMHLVSINPITVTTRLKNNTNSTGNVTSKNFTNPFPAQSFFDVFYEIELPNQTLKNNNGSKRNGTTNNVPFPSGTGLRSLNAPNLFNGSNVSVAVLESVNTTFTTEIACPVCGNSVLDFGEQCDDGNSNNNDECSNECTLTFCGDGIVQSPNGFEQSEQCDDGNTNNNDGCNAQCLLEQTGIHLVKTAGNAPDGGTLFAVVGSSVQFKYNVTNTGQVTLFNVTVEDNTIGFVGLVAVLAPGQSVLLTKSAIVNADQTNIGNATGQSSAGEVSDIDDAIVDVVNPGINMQKLAGDAPEDAVFFTAPGPVLFTYIIRNIGDTHLVFINTTDDNGTVSTTDDYFFNGTNKPVLNGLLLVPGQNVTFNHTIDVFVDRTNIARDFATAAFPNGTAIPGIPTVSGMDDAQVAISECPVGQGQINVTIFSDGTSSKLLQFGLGGGSNSSVKIKLPKGVTVIDARVNITGLPVPFTSENDIDTVVVNDVSGSMDDNCGPDGIAQPGESPCKINDIKNATLEFIGLMLGNPDNKLGLVSYSSAVTGSRNLTNNSATLNNFVNNYTASGFTCVSCGIRQGRIIAVNGTNPARAMILMSDGEANRRMIGGSPFTSTDADPSIAKAEAIAEAANTWQNFSVRVHTIAFGADADALTMQDIANAGNGSFFMANETNITEVFESIGVVLTNSFPTNPTLDIGADTFIDWSFAGEFSGTIRLENFEDEVTALLANCTCTGCSLAGDECTIDFKTTSDTAGKILYDDLYLSYIVECAFCGDNATQPELGEQCDDGNQNNTDTCSNVCTLTLCGDAITQNPNGFGQNEQCDDGNANNNDACKNDCTSNICGDGFVEQGIEACDDGNQNNNDACKNDCTLNVCGDGFVGPGEACDDGNQINNDTCTNACTLPQCGDNILQTGEQCDDGNTQNGDGCSTVCQQEFARLKVTKIVINNNGGAKNVSDFPLFVNSTPVTSGVQNVFSPGTYTVSETAQLGYASSISGDCSSSGLVTLAFGQNKSCTITNDDIPGRLVVIKSVINNDGRNKTASDFNITVSGSSPVPSSFQGSGAGTNVTINAGAYSVNETLHAGYAAAFSANCTGAIANNQTKICIITNDDVAICGDGVLQTNEQCDDGNNNNNDGCNAQCVTEFCGDGIDNNVNEECDDGNQNNADQCANNCELTFCTDGIVQSPNGEGTGGPLNDGFESCDDGNQNNADTCTKFCTETFCGDLIIQTPNGNGQIEECEDGNSIDGDGCDHKCRIEICGNGRKDKNEQCDDGNIVSGDGCSAQCVIEFCGDGIKQAGLGEQCDDGANNDITNGCTDVCTLTFCGDGVVQQHNGQGIEEQCDDSNVIDEDGCSQRCQIEFCGDGVVQAGLAEECDDSNQLSGDGCSAQCKEEFCGDNVVQNSLGEQCELPGTSDNSNCQQTNSTCSENKLGIRDNFGSCSQSCGCVPDNFVFQCVQGACGATCDSNEDCSPSTCENTFTDVCVGNQLKEFDNDKILDSTTVSNSVQNTCDTASSCGCSNNPVSCEAPPTNTYCVSGVCGAACDSESDFLLSGETCSFGCDTGETCSFDNSCSLANHCGGTGNNTFFFSGQCSAQGCAFTEDRCGGHDFVDQEPVVFCNGDSLKQKFRLHTFICAPQGCQEVVTFINETLIEDCNLKDGNYCAGNGVETRNYTCDPQALQCNFTVTGTEQCGTDGWFNTGDVRGFDDPTCENRDFFCQDSGLQDFCTHTVLESRDFDNQDGNYCTLDNEGREVRDYFCNSNGNAAFAVVSTEDCGTEGWTGGNDFDAFGDDPACAFTDFFCTGQGPSAVCSSDSSIAIDFDEGDDPDVCFENKSGRTDFFCNLSTCDSQNPENGCQPGSKDYIDACSIACGAECESNANCPLSECSETFNDFCSGKQLTEFDNDKVLDSTTVTNSVQNTCDTASTCGCSDNVATCSPPQTNTYCVQGVCGAVCDENADCGPFFEGDFCVFSNTCDTASSCGCQEGEREFCPAPGTVVSNGVETCYFGSRECTNDGCALDTCILGQNQFCHPQNGCTDLECTPLDGPITEFNNGSLGRLVTYGGGGGVDNGAKVLLPGDLQISVAMVNVTGIPISFTNQSRLDVVVVNDVSGSMDDNCGPDGVAQPGESPCKINDLKNATNQFVDLMLNNTNNTVGLVSYSSAVTGSRNLTKNATLLHNFINNYTASGFTCVSCGIRQGRIIAVNGTNPARAMILMSDGEANRRMIGGSPFTSTDADPSVAKAEAIAQAADAWQNHSVRVHTIAFGADADVTTMQNIANAGNGTFRFANETNITLVFQELASQITQSFPTNPSLDVGSNAILEWFFPGPYSTQTKVNFTPEAISLLNTCSCPGCVFNAIDNTCTIDFSLASASAGQLLLHNLSIDGCLLQPPPTLCVDGDGDGFTNAACGGTDCNDNNINVHPGATETCNSVDDNCANGIDEGFDVGAACSAGVGACQVFGTKVCSQGAAVCSAQPGTPTAEICDALDNDCDGIVDDFSQSCYTGPPGTAGVGLCQAGTKLCTAGSFGACTGEVTPAAEICDSLDNDCDGSTDEGLSGGSCSTGQSGVCMVGTTQCQSGQLACVPNQLPSEEICDQADNDCDGLTDEGVCPLVCGNNVVDPGEECDDGNSNNNDACTNACQNAECGDGFVRTGIEQCDDSNTQSGDGCNAQCITEVCGDGIVNNLQSFVYDNFSGSSLNTSKWNVTCGEAGVVECVSIVGLNTTADTLQFEQTTPPAVLTVSAVRINSLGHVFVPGEMLDFDMVYSHNDGNQSVAVAYNALLPDPSAVDFFLVGHFAGDQPDGNLAGTYHFKITFLAGKKITAKITKPDSSVVEKNHSYTTDNPFFYLTAAAGEDGTFRADFDNFVITTSVEECDDFNQNNNDQCSNVCTLNECPATFGITVNTDSLAYLQGNVVNIFGSVTNSQCLPAEGTVGIQVNSPSTPAIFVGQATLAGGNYVSSFQLSDSAQLGEYTVFAGFQDAQASSEFNVTGQGNDDDNDGVLNNNDQCPNTPQGQAVNQQGCACSQLTCDDSNACTDDTCSAGNCIFTSDDTNTCDDGLFCTTNVCSSGVCQATPLSCSDGLFCNGAESCNEVTDICQPGTPPPLDDGVSCTIDSCNEQSDVIVHAPDNSVCSNGLFCDGAETCNAALGCQPGTPPVCSDSNACTTDSCNEQADECQFVEIPECQAGHVVINEFVSDPVSGNSSDEWIEIHNPTGSGVDVTGWQLTEDSGATTILFGIIPAGGFMTIDNPAGILNDAGDQLMLKTGAEVVVDMVTYGNFNDGNTADNAPAAADPASTGREVDGLDTDVDIDDFVIFNCPTKNMPNSAADCDPPAAPTSLQISMLGGNVQINWTASASGDVAGYHVYVANSTNGFNVTASNATVNGTNFTDIFHQGAQQRYYIIRAFDGNSNEEANTNVVGKFTYSLVKKTGFTGKNWITLPLNTTLKNAKDAITSVGSNASVISRFNASLQAPQSFLNIGSGIGLNFTLQQGEGYELTVSGNTTWTIVGKPYAATPAISLVFKTGSTGKNWIGLPLSSALLNANGILTSVGINANNVRRLNPDTQLFENWNGAGTNFATKDGEGYEISVAANTTWTPV